MTPPAWLERPEINPSTPKIKSINPSYFSTSRINSLCGSKPFSSLPYTVSCNVRTVPLSIGINPDKYRAISELIPIPRQAV